MKVKDFISQLEALGVGFYSGVPDSLLKPISDFLMQAHGISNTHIIAPNEGNAVALAAGYHLATGGIPCVYLQNSGIGNAINPAASLLHEKVYGIPCVFLVGWRGEPGVHDEPQHAFQGEITLGLLDVMGIACMVIDANTRARDVEDAVARFRDLLRSSKSVAFVFRKGALSFEEEISYANESPASREEIIRAITETSGDDIIVATTGKTSRELFEIREREGRSHAHDFLTVGSMGHSSSIALAIALHKPRARVWCIDGDGSALMHMGAMAAIGAASPANLIHVIINNGAHESVGGQPTVAAGIDFVAIAQGCRYREAYRAEDLAELRDIIPSARKARGPVMIEIKSAIGSRKDLGRPTVSPAENKKALMSYLRERE